MIEVRLHGRGGQGAVTSAELMAITAINQGQYAQAFPNFGAERRGAPVVAFFRIDQEPITTRNMIYHPNMVIVLDPSILRLIDISAGLKEDGILVANTRYSGKEIQEELGIKQALATVDANTIAREELGLPITNTTMLGAILKAKGFYSPNDLVDPLKERFGRIAEKNIKAMKRAYEETKISDAVFQI